MYIVGITTFYMYHIIESRHRLKSLINDLVDFKSNKKI